MSSENSDIKPIHNESLQSIFEWMPACAMVIDSNGVIHELNQKAIQFFRATTKEDFIFDKQNIANMIIDSHRAVELIKSVGKGTELINKEILIRRFDKTIAGVDFFACQFPDNPTRILIQFHERKNQNQVFIHELSQAFKRDAQRLKPYLNKPGKYILEEIISNNTVEGTVSNKASKKNNIIIVSEDRINKLTTMFPQFSNKELTICGYLSLKMSVDEISSLTGQTPNSLRVSFHRILKKTTFTSGKEFLRSLESL